MKRFKLTCEVLEKRELEVEVVAEDVGYVRELIDDCAQDLMYDAQQTLISRRLEIKSWDAETELEPDEDATRRVTVKGFEIRED